MGRVTSDRSGNERHTGEWNSDGTRRSVGNGRGDELDVAEAEVDHGGVNAGAPAITPGVVEDHDVLFVELDAGFVVSYISERDAIAVSLVDENTGVISTLEDLPALLARVAAEGSTNGEGVGRGCACGVNQRHKQAKSQEMQADIHFRLNGEV